MTGAGNEPPPLSKADARLQRNLKILVTAMGVLILLGLAAIAVRVVYLAGQPPPATLSPKHTLALPDGAAVRSLAMAGSRLAVHYTAPGGDGIAILDVETGRLVSRVHIVPEADGR